MMELKELASIIEAVLLVSSDPVTLDQIEKLFPEDGERPDTQQIEAALTEL